MAETRPAEGLETINRPAESTPDGTPAPLPNATIRAYDAKRDQKLARYLIGAGVMEP